MSRIKPHTTHSHHHLSSYLDSSRHQEICQHRLHFGLARFEIITTQEHILLLCKFYSSWHKGILRRPIDVGALQRSQ